MEQFLTHKLTLDKDLPKVVSIIYCAKDKWYNLGIQLGICISKLDDIKAKNDDPLRDMLIEMLKDEKSKTWADILTSLSDPSVDQKNLANEVRDKITKGKLRTYRISLISLCP